MNMAHGPDRDEGMRHEQFQEMMKQLFTNMPAHTFALFRARCAQMAAEMDGMFPVVDAGVEVLLYDWLKEHVTYNVMGDRIKMCQFFGW